MKNSINVEIKNPIQQGMKTIEDLFEENINLLKSSSFMSGIKLSCDTQEYILPKPNKFFHIHRKKIYSVEKQKNKNLKIKLLTNFIVKNSMECIEIFNNKSLARPLKHYIVELENSAGRIEKDIEVASNSKSDYKQFQTVLNNSSNGFTMNMTEPEFKAFVAEFMSPKSNSVVTVYNNAGVLEDGSFIFENALVTPEKIYWADESGYIKLDENSFVKLKKNKIHLPRLAKSSESGSVVANNLITNILECWENNYALPLLTLGHCIMSLYFEEFIKGYGAPALVVYGDTGSGKSTLITLVLAMFGLKKEAMTSSGSTIKSSEKLASSYNGIPVAIDDVKEETLTSSGFTTLIKGAYKGIPRTRMTNYGKDIEHINVCSPTAYSTNASLPDLREVINRMNIILIFGKVFDAKKFKYHELNQGNSDNLEKLSLILPELIKIPRDSVMQCYEQVFERIKQFVPETQQRIINNIAYAYTGALLLLAVSGIEIQNFEKEIIDYAKSQIKRYENIKTPVDKVLDAIVALAKMGQLVPETHFRIVDVEYEDKLETHIRFHKDTVLSIINKYYAHDKTKRINESSFLDYAETHFRFRRNNHPTRFDDNTGKPSGAICFNISGLNDFASFCSGGICAMSYDELKSNLENNTK